METGGTAALSQPQPPPPPVYYQFVLLFYFSFLSQLVIDCVGGTILMESICYKQLLYGNGR